MAVIRQLKTVSSDATFCSLAKVGFPERTEKVQQAESSESRLVAALINVESPS